MEGVKRSFYLVNFGSVGLKDLDSLHGVDE